MLKNKVAIITGGGSGLGEAACKLLALNGAKVVVADFNYESAQRVEHEIIVNGGNAIAVKVDVRDTDYVNALVWDVIHTYGQIDILVNNAGITRDKSFLKMTEEMWNEVIDVNLNGVVRCTRAVLPHMLERGTGRIINTSSVVRNGNYGQSNYVASKAAVVGLTKTWAKEFGPKGINVNAVAPGFMRTPMTAAMPPEILDKMAKMVPLKRLGDPEDIANAYLFLASPMSKYVNGTVLEVDGGLVI